MVEGGPMRVKHFEPTTSCLTLLAPKILESRRLARLEKPKSAQLDRTPAASTAKQHRSSPERTAAASAASTAKPRGKKKEKKAKPAPTFDLADLLPEHYVPPSLPNPPPLPLGLKPSASHQVYTVPGILLTHFLSFCFL